jgi:type IV secretory pathway TraG/TraD family ATPase VirD4
VSFGTSEAARWQAAQTRARIGASLWWTIIKFTVFVWLIFTIAVVWHETGEAFPELHHQYFGRWVLCSLFTGIPLLDRVGSYMILPFKGNWYALPDVAAWLNDPQAYYRGTFGQWFWHYSHYTTLAGLLIPALMFARSLRRDRDTEHVRGLRLLSRWRHNRQLNGGLLTKVGRAIRWLIYVPQRGHDAGMRLGGSVIPEQKEAEHFLISGSPGSGKSTLIRHMLAQIQERGQGVVVIDPDSEFVQEFYNERRGDVVMNPLDARCPFWSPWLELRADNFAMDSEALAASLIRGQPRNNSEAFFQESSRTLLESIFQVLKGDQDNRGIGEFLAQSRGKIHKALVGTAAYPLVDPEATEQGSGILATASNAVKPFSHLPLPDQTTRTWSAREWAQNREGWVFLCSTEDGRAATQKLQGVWLDSLVRWLMSAEIGSKPTWLVADEFPVLGYQPQLEQLVVRGRKRGLCVVLAFQNVAQIRALYGRDGATTLTSSPTSKVIMRSDETETAKWASELLGSHEILRLSMTAMAGLSEYREGFSMAPHRSTEHIISPAEIQLLKPFQGFLCVAGHDRCAIRIPERHLDPKQAVFVPRSQAELSTPTTAKAPASNAGGRWR